MTTLRLDLDDADIGKWTQRERPDGRPLTLPHYLDSVIAGGAVTHCGRRMRRATGRPFHISAAPLRRPVCQSGCQEMDV